MISDALSLFRADLLKLRRRRGLMALAAVICVGSVTLMFTVNAIRHGSNPNAGPAGGTKNFGNATDFLGLMGVVVAAMLGATAGAGDAEAGVLRDLVATGRSRAGMFLSRTASALGVTLPLLVAALAVAIVASIVFAGSLGAPSASVILQRTAAVLAFGAGTVVVATGIATFAKSRGSVIAVVITFNLVVSLFLIQASFLGDLRQLLPLEAFTRMSGERTEGVSMALATAVAVTVGWAVAAAGAAAWWSRRVEV